MKKLLSLFAIAIAMMACAQPAKVAGDQERLWYDAPAGRWLEALPLGNGQMAAMVFGGIADETIQLNESTFWSGSPHDNNSKTSLQHLDEVRQLIYAGREEEAEALINKEFIPGPHGQRFLTLGSLRMHFENMPEEVEDYCRDLDLTRAVAGVGFTANGVRYTRSAFAALRDRALVIRLDASKKGALTFSLTQDCKFPFEVATEGNTLVTRIKGVEHEGIPGGLTAECRTQVISDGKVAAEDKRLTISGATHVTLLVNAATNYVNYHDISGDESAAAKAGLAAAAKLSYKKLLARHEAAYGEQYGRCSIKLHSGANAALPTDQRKTAFQDSDDMGMVALIFNYGRYLLISSSQPGGQPANLQGIWNDEVMAPWDSKYTIKICRRPARLPHGRCMTATAGWRTTIRTSGASRAPWTAPSGACTPTAALGWPRTCGPITSSPRTRLSFANGIRSSRERRTSTWITCRRTRATATWWSSLP